MDLLFHIMIYCLVSSIYLYATLAINPRIWMHRMPRDVVQKVPPRTKSEKNLLILLATPFLVFTLLYPAIYAWTHSVSFWSSIFVYFAFFLAFDIWDTLILDVFIFCTITPKFIIIKGTKKEDYADRKYHLQSGLKGLWFVIIGSIVLGIVTYLIKILI